MPYSPLSLGSALPNPLLEAWLSGRISTGARHWNGLNASTPVQPIPRHILGPFSPSNPRVISGYQPKHPGTRPPVMAQVRDPSLGPERRTSRTSPRRTSHTMPQCIPSTDPAIGYHFVRIPDDASEATCQCGLRLQWVSIRFARCHPPNPPRLAHRFPISTCLDVILRLFAAHTPANDQFPM